jgi:hypothetical protein
MQVGLLFKKSLVHLNKASAKGCKYGCSGAVDKFVVAGRSMAAPWKYLWSLGISGQHILALMQ